MNGDAMKKTKKTSRDKGIEPSKASLREIPEIDFAKTPSKKNPYAERVARGGLEVKVGRGRPRKLEQVGGTKPRSVRFPQSIWEQIDEKAREEGQSTHAAMRQAILSWLKRSA